LLYTPSGVQDENTIPDNEGRQSLSTFIYNKLPRRVKIEPNAINDYKVGARVEKVPDAIEHLAAGKVSGEAIVFSL